MKKHSIRYRLFFLSAKVTVIGMIISFIVCYLYSWIANGAVFETFNFSDYLNALISTFLAITVALGLSLRFTSGMITPIASIIESARKIAEGELSARASRGKYRITEMDHLVSDFNLMAEKLDHMSREMKVWNAAIAHELRTPVTVLRSHLQGIHDGIIQPDSTSIAGLIKHTDSLTHMIEDLRVISLADTGQLRLFREFVDLKVEMRTLLSTLAPQFAEKGKVLVQQLEDVSCYVDAHRIKQGILALLHNALDYSSQGKVVVSCREQAGNVEIVVEDEGPGIAPEEREKIFDAFYRADSERPSHVGASGLGLSVVRAIVLAHGGDVRCEPSALGGISFRMTLQAG